MVNCRLVVLDVGHVKLGVLFSEAGSSTSEAGSSTREAGSSTREQRAIPLFVTGSNPTETPCLRRSRRPNGVAAGFSCDLARSNCHVGQPGPPESVGTAVASESLVPFARRGRFFWDSGPFPVSTGPAHLMALLQTHVEPNAMSLLQEAYLARRDAPATSGTPTHAFLRLHHGAASGSLTLGRTCRRAFRPPNRGG